jgi:hypothetical protein
MIKTLDNGKFEVTIGKTVTQFDTEAQATEALANHANREATVLWAKAGEGGTKYRDEAFGLAIIRHAVNAEFKARKTKAKDITAAEVFDTVAELTPEDLDNVVKNAKALIAALSQLRGDHQAPMKGGTLPRNVAEAATVLVKAETGAAQQAAAQARILSAL